MRLPALASALVLPALALPALALGALPALAQTPTAPAKPAGTATGQTAPAAPAAASAPADPVVASVNGQDIHMSDVQQAANALPAQLQQLPPQQLFPMIVDQLIDQQALLIAAKKEKLEDDPSVAAAMRQAADQKLESAYIQEKVGPLVTDDAVKAAYQAQYAGKPGPEQVEARHILVKTKDQAESIIKQLEHGAKFDELAKKYSSDPGSSANGGELGWFAQGDMVPAFANAAFALQPGQYTKTPVQTQFGWHVIEVEGKRTAPAPSFDDVKDKIHQELVDEAIKQTLSDVRSQVTVRTFAPGGAAAAAPAPSASQ